MKRYRIRVDEVYAGIYEIEADSAQDAFERYLFDGEFIDRSDDFDTHENTAEITEIDGDPLPDSIGIFDFKQIARN